jgi:hypothetical protein
MLSLVLLMACSNTAGGGLFGKGDGENGESGGGGVDTDDTGSDTDVEGELTPLPSDCSDLGAPTGATVAVSPDDDLVGLVAEAAPYTTFLLADGTYALTGGDAASEVDVRARGVTIRGASADASRVVLDGGFATTELIAIEAHDVTIADLTLTQSYGAAISVRGVSGARIFRVRVDEPGKEALLAEASRDGLAYPDDGIIACSTFARETWCGTSVELSQAEGWSVRDSAFEQPLCPEVAFHAATGSRGTTIERSTFSSLSIALQLGDTEYTAGVPRAYADAECDGETVGHYGGLVQNVFVRGGLRLEEACGTRVLHTTVYGGDLAWSFSQDLTVTNVLAAVNDTGGATVTGQRRPTGTDLVDAAGGDLHLTDGSGARGAGVSLAEDVAVTDIDGEERPREAPDVGADQWSAR